MLDHLSRFFDFEKNHAVEFLLLTRGTNDDVQVCLKHLQHLWKRYHFHDFVLEHVKTQREYAYDMYTRCFYTYMYCIYIYIYIYSTCIRDVYTYSKMSITCMSNSQNMSRQCKNMCIMYLYYEIQKITYYTKNDVTFIKKITYHIKIAPETIESVANIYLNK